MRDYPDYPEEWANEDHPQAEFWKTDPDYWRATLDDADATRRDEEEKRHAWLREWTKENHGDMMGQIAYVTMRLREEIAECRTLAARLRLCQLGFPDEEPQR